MAGKALEMLPGLPERAGIGFSGRHNAACGTAGSVRVPVPVCRDRACASGATGTLAVRHRKSHIPSSAWVPSRIRGACSGQDAMRERCPGSLAATVREARRPRIPGRARCVVAPACHPMPGHGRDPATRERQLVRARHRSGTSRSGGYATAKVAGGPGPDLARGPKKGSAGAGIVRELLLDCAGVGVRPRPVLPGRGFFPAGVVGELSGPGHGPVMPAPRAAGAKGAAGEHGRGERAAASPHALAPRERRASEPFTPVTVPEGDGDDGRNPGDVQEANPPALFSSLHTCGDGWDSGDVQEGHLAYATNSDAGGAYRPAGVPDEYRKRWGTGTGHGDAGKARPRTASPDASVRTFLFFMALVTCNLWTVPAAWSAGWYGSRDTAPVQLAIMPGCIAGMAAGGADGGRAGPN